MKTLKIKAVILTDGENYFIHGSNEESPEAMFKAMTAIWHFDPATEQAHYVELIVSVPELEGHAAPVVVEETNDNPDTQ